MIVNFREIQVLFNMQIMQHKLAKKRSQNRGYIVRIYPRNFSNLAQEVVTIAKNAGRDSEYHGHMLSTKTKQLDLGPDYGSFFKLP